MVGTFVHGADDYCWHIPFTLWTHRNGLMRSEHDLHVRVHPFQAPQCPVDGLVLGRFGKTQRTEMMYCDVHLCSWSWQLVLACSVCLVDVCQLINKHGA